MQKFKTRYLKIICVLFIATAACSCGKYLELKPQDGIIREDFWKTKEQLQAAVDGCYASLLGGSDRPIPEYMFLWGELRADLLTPSTGVTSEETDIMNVNILATNSLTNWRAIYRTINYCNTVIDFGPGVLKVDQTLTQQSLDASLAEVKALRALLYFYLVRSFRDVPLVVKSTSSDDQLQQLTKTSGAEVLQQIIKDLSEAETAAPLTYNSNADDKGRITRYTVYAIQADVYLWMEKYPEALAACNKIINSQKFGLVSGNTGWFTNVFVNGNSSEGIFEIQFDRTKLNSFYPMFRTRPRFIASSIITDPDNGIYMADVLDPTKKDIRGDGAAARFGDGLIWKYIGVDDNTMRVAEESFAHWIVYRYADILLMKAEALALTGKGPEALDLVNTIRQRAKALTQTARVVDPTDAEAVCDYILEERAREFAYEGKRWYDVLRHAKRNNYKRQDILTEMVSRTVSGSLQQSAIAKFKDANSHYFPIYTYELQTDKNLVQNPFYK
ncbi:RagB/SusD family nutrient uptake outer membrane protein [Pinibacter soli]|uniref:RagB/SusD family nutrient uptake outer membrane protein n=1 Tax=Pinibacter soli TaxID=3044211 RepID=A0ABT6R9Q3_9BACT|nr:RagB/SusD family nutrient uptake outer membrane protein [Pinibacter soli]MDI3319282.1 RagB/SusD family nutrient uptake outer membrane protein [Pinibacter soli]